MAAPDKIRNTKDLGVISEIVPPESTTATISHEKASTTMVRRALALGDVNKVVPVDKSSTVLTVLLAIFLFQEKTHLILKLAGTLLLAAGIFLMIEKKQTSQKKENRRWLIYALLSALFASLTSILAKVGITGVESNLGTAIRTGVVLIMAWLVVLIKNRETSVRLLKEVPKGELLFISLSGLATGASWLCYYYAIQNGPVSVVVPIDKLSILVTIVFSRLVFSETLSRKALLGLILMVLGTLIIAL